MPYNPTWVAFLLQFTTTLVSITFCRWPGRKYDKELHTRTKSRRKQLNDLISSTKEKQKQKGKKKERKISETAHLKWFAWVPYHRFMANLSLQRKSLSKSTSASRVGWLYSLLKKYFQYFICMIPIK